MTSTPQTPKWFVMTHRTPSHFMQWMKRENAKRLADGRPLIEPFYPNDFLHAQPTAPEREPTTESNTLRADFAKFVFLKGTDNDIKGLVEESKGKALYYPLRHYLDTNGNHATVPDRMMKMFLDACMNYRGRFELMAPLSSIEAQDKVMITSGPFAGQEAFVVKVRHAHKAIHLDLSIQLVKQTINIRMSNVDKRQIAILSREAEDSLRTDFIEYTQNHLLSILAHRVKRVDDEEVMRRDADMLARLYRYRYHEIGNETARNHFLALMLICTHLCRFASDEQALRTQLLSILAELNKRSESKAATDTRTYLWIALYISTRDPAYRDAAKQYIQQYQPKSTKLRRFVSLIRTGIKI